MRSVGKAELATSVDGKQSERDVDSPLGVRLLVLNTRYKTRYGRI